MDLPDARGDRPVRDRHAVRKPLRECQHVEDDRADRERGRLAVQGRGVGLSLCQVNGHRGRGHGTDPGAGRAYTPDHTSPHPGGRQTVQVISRGVSLLIGRFVRVLRDDRYGADV